MKNGLENGYYHEITPSGFGIAIKASKLLYSKQSDFQKVEVFETESALTVNAISTRHIMTKRSIPYNLPHSLDRRFTTVQDLLREHYGDRKSTRLNSSH